MGEEGNIQKKIRKFPGTALPIPIGIHRTGDALEGKEGDAHGGKQRKLGRCAQNFSQEKVQILVSTQQKKICSNRQNADGFCKPSSMDAYAEYVIESPRDQQHNKPLQTPEGIEHKSCRQQEKLPSLLVLNHGICTHRQRQEHAQKEKGVQSHFLTLLKSPRATHKAMRPNPNRELYTYPRPSWCVVRSSHTWPSGGHTRRSHRQTP